MRSLWLEEALDRPGEADTPALEGDERADVCIVGGGYTGLWTALRLKELDPALEVAIVEADVCGGGASGRNGGLVLSWWAKLASLKKVVGAAEAVRLAAASAEAVGEIGRFCVEQGIDAHYRADGWLWTATNGAQLGAWDETVATAEALGVKPFRRLSSEEIATRAGSTAHVAGIYEETAATVQPALLARGLRRVALERGIRIFERSRMTALERALPPVVRTARGSVTADKVLLAMNAWIVAIRELRRTLVVIASDMVATEPIPQRLAELGLADGICISDSRLLVNYFRTTVDGRLAWGKGGGAVAFGSRVGSGFEGTSPRAAAVEAAIQALYPSLAGVRTTHSWTGPIDRSATALPYLGRLGGRADVHYSYGFSGNGVGPCRIAGKILASRLLDRDDEWSSVSLPAGPTGTFPWNRAGAFPPEPLRYIGGRTVRAAVERAERDEDAGRRPGRLTARLVGLAPAGLTPTHTGE